MRNDEQSLCMWVASLLWVRTGRGVVGGWVVGGGGGSWQNGAPPPPPSPREKVNPYATIGFTSPLPPQSGFLTDCCGYLGSPARTSNNSRPHQFLFRPPVKVGNFSKANNCLKVPTSKKSRPQKVIPTFLETKF